MMQDEHVRAWHEHRRHECEVRHVAKMPQAEQIEFCKGIEKKRGRQAAIELYKAVKAYEED